MLHDDVVAALIKTTYERQVAHKFRVEQRPASFVVNIPICTYRISAQVYEGNGIAEHKHRRGIDTLACALGNMNMQVEALPLCRKGRTIWTDVRVAQIQPSPVPRYIFHGVLSPVATDRLARHVVENTMPRFRSVTGMAVEFDATPDRDVYALSVTVDLPTDNKDRVRELIGTHVMRVVASATAGGRAVFSGIELHSAARPYSGPRVNAGNPFVEHVCFDIKAHIALPGKF